VPGDVFPGASFLEGTRLAKRFGIDAVELHSWWEEDFEKVLASMKMLGVEIAAICAPFVQITDPQFHAEYLSGMRKTLAAARKLSCTTVIVTTGDAVKGIDREAQHRALVKCLEPCAELFDGTEVALALEPLNTMPGAVGCADGYYLWSSDEAFAICREVGSERMKVLFDVYHQQVMEGNIIDRLTRNIGLIQHVHVAGVPGRAELEIGELDYAQIFAALKQAGYNGYIGLEYAPRKGLGEGISTALTYL
jgi:hydroxypyruvate isomerase